MSELDISRVLPGWQVEGVLGSGTFGTEYLIRQSEENGAFSALKVMRVPPQKEAIDNAVKLGIGRDLLTTYFGKFKNDLTWELTMYKTVESRHLAPVEELVTEDEAGPGWTGYMRTGIYTPMATYFEKAEATPEDAARLGIELSSALEALGRYGLIHGEITPENVLVTDAGSFVLSDFAVRRCLEKAGSGIFERGDESFEAPEVGEERSYSAQSDIYSLGALMCYTANGCHMPENRDPGLIKNMDPALEAVIRRAMSADPAKRYQTAQQMRADLEKLSIGKKSPRRAMAAAAAFDAVKRNGGAAMTGAAATAVAAKAAASKATSTAKAATSTAKAATSTAKAATSTAKTDTSTAKPATTAKQTAKPAQPSGKSTAGKTSQKAGGAAQPSSYQTTPAPTQPKAKKSKAGYIVGAVTALLIVAAVAAIWWPRAEEEPDPSDFPPIVTDPSDITSPSDTSKPDDTTDPSDTTGSTEPSDTTEPNDTTGSTEPSGQTEPSTSTNPPTTSPSSPSTPATRPEAVNNDVLYPSDKQVITRDELSGKTEAEVQMIINEIYARHGYIFGGSTSATQQYFNSQKWYVPETSSASTVEKRLNDTENKNIKVLTEYRSELRNPTKPTEPKPTGTRPSEPAPTGTGPAATEPSAPKTPTDNTIIFPSDTKLLTNTDLDAMTQEEIGFVKNEIFARHGYIFKKAIYRDYFTNQQWYTPVTDDSEAVARMFNDTEKANVSTIQAYVHAKGWE